MYFLKENVDVHCHLSLLEGILVVYCREKNQTMKPHEVFVWMSDIKGILAAPPKASPPPPVIRG